MGRHNVTFLFIIYVGMYVGKCSEENLGFVYYFFKKNLAQNRMSISNPAQDKTMHFIGVPQNLGNEAVLDTNCSPNQRLGYHCLRYTNAVPKMTSQILSGVAKTSISAWDLLITWCRDVVRMDVRCSAEPVNFQDTYIFRNHKF